MPKHDPRVLADLARSGLTPQDADAMHVRLLTDAQVKKLTRFFLAPAYELPYLTIKGRINGFSRLRFLTPVLDERSGKQLRYWQAPKTPAHVYFAPGVDWGAILADPKVPVYVTEGEKKAYAGCKLLKRPVLGLGGVWSWGSRREKVALLPDLVPFMKDRQVFACFDADPAPNPDVQLALHALGRAARNHGATPLAVQLPSLEPGAKTGLDDFLVARGAEKFLELEPRAFADLAALESMNQELIYVRDKGAIYHLPTRHLLQDSKRLTTVIYADRRLTTFNAKGEAVEKNLAAEWLQWHGRRQHAGLAYEPGEATELNDGRYNVWPGWGVLPKKGDVKPWLKLLDQVFGELPTEERRWAHQWLAYPFQHPGVKLYGAMLVWSRLQGVGKSLIAETLRRIYGENFVSLEAQDLHGDFNEWARHRQFVLGDEVTSRDRREDEQRFKVIVTRETVRINGKYQATYELRDVANYYLTANGPDALSLDFNDRRWFVHEVTRQTIEPEWYTQVYHQWYRDPVNAAAVFDWLLRVDLKGFDPRATVPATRAKRAMQGLSDAPIDFVVRDLLDSPVRYLLGSMRQLYTAAELAALLEPHGRPHAVTVAKALARAGVRHLDETRTTRGNLKLYPIGARDRWLKASHAERAAHYDGKEVK